MTEKKILKKEYVTIFGVDYRTKKVLSWRGSPSDNNRPLKPSHPPYIAILLTLLFAF
jgi:hypothetical protein